ncbi:MAG: hypothetical protein V7707_04155 [Motiliproteus sp.]
MGRKIISFSRRAALLPLLLPVLALLGAKFYLHLSATSLVEQSIASLPASVQLRYDDIDSSFDGVIDLYGTTLQLEGMSQPSRIERLQLITEHWRELSQTAALVREGALPDWVQLRFQIAEPELARFAQASVLPSASARRFLGCFQPQADTASAVISSVLFNGSFEYHFDSQSEYLNADLKLAAEERFQLQLTSDLDIGSSRLALALDTTQVGLGGAELQFFNLGAQTQLLADCGATGRSGLVQGSYVARQSNIAKYSLQQQGWVASTELEFAYQDYLFLPVQLKLQLLAPYAVSLQQLQHSTDSWSAFSLTLGLNQSEVSTLQWQPDANTDAIAAAAALLRAQPKLAPAQVVGSPTEAKPEPKKNPAPTPLTAQLSKADVERQLDQAIAYHPSYKPVAVRQLAGLVGTPLRLTTRNGRQIDGVLDALERNRLQLRRELKHGVSVVPVRLDLISGIQAYF